MALRDELSKILSYVRIFEEDIEHNDELFKIFEGDLLPFIEEDLRQELSPDVFKTMRPRIIPLNILIRIVKKLSKSYAMGVTRQAENPTDQELMDWYVNEMQLDTQMHCANEFLNVHKYTALEPWVSNGKPQVRILPANQFLPYSSDMNNPLNLTHFVKFMGQVEVDDYADRESTSQEIVNKYHIFSDEEFWSTTDNGDLVRSDMMDNEGQNPYGKIPFIYVSRSKNLLVPLRDTDTKSMTMIIPKLLSDLAFANLYTSHSIYYGVDVDAQNLKIAPNAFWQFKSDPATGNRPEVNTITPSVQVEQTLSLIQFTLASWMESRGLRPGATGSGLSSDNAVSGISLMIQNMDTSEDRRIQNQIFKAAEEDLWDLIANHLHPIWSQTGMIPERRQFSQDFAPMISFPDPVPFVPLKEKAEAQALLINQGLTSRKRAMKDIHSGLDEEEFDQLIAEIEEDELLRMPQMEVEIEEEPIDQDSEDSGSDI